MNSKIVLAQGIKMDKDYTNIIEIGTEALVNLCYANATATAEDFTFIRSREAISTPFGYNACLVANYVAFQNPDYSNKWFFGWIDSVRYVSDGCTEITYTIDYMSTYWNDWTFQPCFVEREHIEEDIVGRNRQSEPIYLGDYTSNDDIWIDCSPDGIYMALSEKYADSKFQSPPFIINTDGIPQAFTREGGHISQARLLAMQGVYENYVHEGKASDLIAIQTYPDIEDDYTAVSVVRPASLDGYTPKNKKLFQYPYCKILVTNNISASNEYAYEDFTEQRGQFKLRVCKSGNPQVVSVPQNYRGLDKNYDNAVMLGDYPQVPCSADSYSAYVGTNGTKTAMSVIGNILGVATNIAGGNIGGAVGSAYAGVSTTTNYFIDAQHLPDQMHGCAGGNYVAMTMGSFGFKYIKQSIRFENAKCIDDYFTRYGYATNRLKVPAVARPYFNYIKVSADSTICTAGIPSEAKDTINSVFRKGVTVWKSHDSLGDFSVDNTL